MPDRSFAELLAAYGLAGPPAFFRPIAKGRPANVIAGRVLRAPPVILSRDPARWRTTVKRGRGRRKGQPILNNKGQPISIPIWRGMDARAHDAMVRDARRAAAKRHVWKSRVRTAQPGWRPMEKGDGSNGLVRLRDLLRLGRGHRG